MINASTHYYVRSEGWERCVDCLRRYLEDMHAEALGNIDGADKRELLKRIKIAEEDMARARKQMKTATWFNRLEHGCLCCTYEKEYGEGQKSVTESVAYWTDKLKEQRQERAAQRHASKSRQR